MTDITLNPISSGYNLQKINDNFVKIENNINDTSVQSAEGNNVMQQDLDINSNRFLNVPAPEAPTDVLRLQDLGGVSVFDGNIVVAKDESTLVDGQTTVEFNLDIDAEYSVVDIHGRDVDSSRILLGDGYTIGITNNIIELTDSYPAGTKVVVSQGTIAGGTEVSSVFNRTGVVVAQSGDYSAVLISFDDTNVSFTATEVQEAIEALDVPDPQVAINTGNISTNTTDITNLKGLNPNNQAGTTYTLALTDADNGEIWMDNASSNTVTIPLHATVAMPERSYLVTQEGVGVTSITAVAGVLLNGIDGGTVDITAQYSGAAITKRADNTWVITGAIGVVS